MRKYIFLLLNALLIFGFVLYAHEGHNDEDASTLNIIQKAGEFHPILLHFPIALLVMVGISEVLFLVYPLPLFYEASRFMLLAAAIFVIPTVLTGLAFGYSANYDTSLFPIYWWHRFCGITTAILCIAVAYIREKQQQSVLYYAFFAILFICVNITGYLGGLLTFGPLHLFS